MYDTYSQQIYNWLVNTFYPSWQNHGESILERLDIILSVIQYGLYMGVFAFLFWLSFTLVRPHFFKC